MKILFVEDDPSIRDIISIFLRGFSCQFEFAIDGDDALLKLKSSEVYDIVFLDQSMPFKKGDEVASEFRAWEKIQNRKATLIYAMTAFQDEFTLKKLLNAGCNEVVVKPVSKKVLIDLLTRKNAEVA